MINLLPPETKSSIHYARRNSVLLRWLIWLSAGIMGIVLVAAGGMVFLNQAVHENQVLVTNTQSQLKSQNLNGVTKQVSAITNNLKLMVTVLGKEVLFSELLRQVATAMPKGAVLTDLNITGVQGGINLEAATVDYNTATQIQVNLQDPNNKIFSKADIVSIQCTTGGTGIASVYPCKAEYRAQFVTNNPYLFINNTSSGSKS
jgi:Tfp pilus assembly protein PilN